MIQYLVMLLTALLIGRLGDTIVAGPFLRALKAKWPGARLRLAHGPLAAEAAQKMPWLDEAILLTPPFVSMTRLMLETSDILVDLNPSFSKTSSALLALARAKEKAGFQRGKLDALFTKTAGPAGLKEHMLDRYARLAALLGLPYDPRLEIRLTAEDEWQAERLLSRAGISGPRRILVHAGNFKKTENRWPEDKFVQLTDILLDQPGLEVIYMAGPGEELETRAIVARLKRRVPILPPSPLGVLGAAMRRMDLCVMNITGTTHLAAAVGARTFGFYTGYTDAVWRLRGPGHTGVVAADWESCRDIAVDAAWEALRARLDMIESRP